MSVFAAGQAGDSRRQVRCHRAGHVKAAAGGDDAGEIADEAERRREHRAGREVGAEVPRDVDVRVGHRMPLPDCTAASVPEQPSGRTSGGLDDIGGDPVVAAVHGASTERNVINRERREPFAHR